MFFYFFIEAFELFLDDSKEDIILIGS